MSDPISDRIVQAAEAAIDGHHRARLGEARSAAIAVLRELLADEWWNADPPGAMSPRQQWLNKHYAEKILEEIEEGGRDA